jgi:hypothetical protein
MHGLRWIDFGSLKGGLSVFQRKWLVEPCPSLVTRRLEADPARCRLKTVLENGEGGAGDQPPVNQSLSTLLLRHDPVQRNTGQVREGALHGGPGQPGEQATMFFLDPCGNAIEFKAFENPESLFAK